MAVLGALATTWGLVRGQRRRRQNDRAPPAAADGMESSSSPTEQGEKCPSPSLAGASSDHDAVDGDEGKIATSSPGEGENAADASPPPPSSQGDGQEDEAKGDEAKGDEAKGDEAKGDGKDQKNDAGKDKKKKKKKKKKKGGGGTAEGGDGSCGADAKAGRCGEAERGPSGGREGSWGDGGEAAQGGAKGAAASEGASAGGGEGSAGKGKAGSGGDGDEGEETGASHQVGQLETAPSLSPLRRSGLFNSKAANLCCVNSPLQLLRHTTPLRQALVALSNSGTRPKPKKKNKKKSKKAPRLSLDQLKTNATWSLADLFSAMEEAPKMHHLADDVTDYIYDGSDELRKGRQEDASQIFRKLVDAIETFPKHAKDGTAAETLKQAMSAMTHEVSRRRTCDCGGYVSERKDTQQVLMLPMETLEEGEAPPGLESLLGKVFATEEVDPCHICQGRIKVAEREESLLRLVGLEPPSSADNTWPETIVHIETPNPPLTLSILRQVLERLNPRLEGATSAIREAVEAAATGIKTVLSEASLDSMRQQLAHLGELGEVDVAMLLLLKAMVQRTEDIIKNDEARPAQAGLQLPDAVGQLRVMRDDAQAIVAASGTQIHENRQKADTMLGTLPNTIFMYLPRFALSRNDPQAKKLVYHVDIPVEVDMAQYTVPSTEVPSAEGQAPEPVLYDLDGVIHHDGAAVHSGHFKTFVRTGKEEWLQYNDSTLYKAEAEVALNKNALMLAYTRRPPREADQQCC